jgi:replication-associated recombination protein RarA
MGLPNTLNNYSPYEVMSALQKCIRRGLEEEALYWAFELTEAGPTNAKVCLSRLHVMAHEDVGLGDPQAALFAIQSVQDTQRWLDAKNGAWRLSLSNAVMALARAKKSRDSDNIQAVVRAKRFNACDLEIPDVALDKHTQRGKRLGRGMHHFLAEGTVLVPDASNESLKRRALEAFNLIDRVGAAFDVPPTKGVVGVQSQESNHQGFF